MSDMDGFLKNLAAEFPEDRLTWQKRLATFHPESADETARFFKLAAVPGSKRKTQLPVGCSSTTR